MVYIINFPPMHDTNMTLKNTFSNYLKEWPWYHMWLITNY